VEIQLRLSKDFERCLDNLKEKYGEDFEYINGLHPSQLDFSEFIDNFVDKDTLADASIDPNANANHKDIRSFMTEKGKAEDKLFALNKIFTEIKKMWGIRTAKQWLEAEFSRAFYLNDSTTASYFPYCWANDFTRLATEGLFFLNGSLAVNDDGKITYVTRKRYNNQAPKHLTTYFDDVIEFVSFLSNRQSGAVGMPNVLIWAWYFWKKDVEDGYYMKDPDYYLRQQFQKLIYRLNQPFLRIDQSSFTNVSIFDHYYLESLFGGVEFPDGTLAIDHIEDLIDCQKVFMEVVSEIRSVNMFTYPVLNYSLLRRGDITEDEAKEMIRTRKWNVFVDKTFARWCSDHNVTWNDANFFCSDNVGVLSNCCRLLSDTSKLDAFINSIGGTALSVGSCRVSTINLVRIAYESEFDKKKYLQILRKRVELDCKALASMRHIIQRNIEKGLLPNYQPGAVELDKQFCTIGGIGMYEVMDLFGLIDTDEFGCKSYSDKAVEFATQILDIMNEVKDSFNCDFSFNIEMIPAENCAGVICQADNLLFETNRYFIYSNQWIPLMEKCTIQEKCRLGSLFDKKCGGGCIAHINVENRFATTDEAWDMLNYVALMGVIYFAFTTKISVCEDKHAFISEPRCPVCGKPIADTYARVVGFYVPVSGYQQVRKREFDRRKWMNVLENDGVMR
jgi:ribonucleoside-triphosphate reductase